MFSYLFDNIGAIIIIIIFIIIAFIGYLLIITAILKNKQMKILDVSRVDETLINKHKKLLEFFSLEDISIFELFNKHFKKINVSSNIIFKSNHDEGKKIIIIIEHYYDEKKRNEIFYTIASSIENSLKKNELELNITIVLEYENNQETIDYLDNDYDLVITDSLGIQDPTNSNIRSHYGFLNTLTIGTAKLKFSTEKIGNGKSRLLEFQKEASKILSKCYLAKPIKEIIKTIGMEMPFAERIIYTNPVFLFPFSKRIIRDSFYNFISGFNTILEFNDIFDDDENYYMDCLIKIAVNNNIAVVLKKLNPLMSKYSINFQVEKSDEQSNFISKNAKDYKIFEKIIQDVYNINVSGSIKEPTLMFNYNSLGVNSLGFSPLNFNEDKKISRTESEVFVVLAIQFYTKLFEEYNRRSKCFAHIVEKN